MGADDKAEEVRAWLEQARWMWGEARARFDANGQQAVTLLALDGVLLGLLAQVSGNVHHGVRHVLLQVAVTLTAASAAVALWSIWPRSHAGVSTPQLRQRWSTYIAKGSADSDTGTFVEMILHGTPESRTKGNGPLDTLRAAADSRGEKNRWSATLVTAAVVIVAVWLVW